MTITALKGGPESLAMLDKISGRLATNIVRGGMRVLARTVAEDAKARAIDDEVAASVGISSRASNGVITSKVRLKGKGSFKGRFLEYGTLPHFISVRDDARPSRRTDGGTRTWSIRQVNTAARRGSLMIGNRFVGATIFHPGARAHPFMRPALDAKLEEGIKAMGQYIAGRLTENGLNAPAITFAEDEG